MAPPRDDALVRSFADIVIVNADRQSEIDLGNRRVSLVPLSGHTRSDVALVDHDAGVTFTGDLMWNGMFPNFVDATPTRLSVSIRQLAQRSNHAFVPGHGAMANGASLTRYIDLLEHLESAARIGRTAGKSAVETAAGYAVPKSLGEWMASKTGLERAMTAWYRELDAAR